MAGMTIWLQDHVIHLSFIVYYSLFQIYLFSLRNLHFIAVFNDIKFAIKTQAENKCSSLSCICKTSPLVEDVGRVIRMERLLIQFQCDQWLGRCFMARAKYTRTLFGIRAFLVSHVKYCVQISRWANDANENKLSGSCLRGKADASYSRNLRSA